MSETEAEKLARRAALLVICSVEIAGGDFEEALTNERSTLIDEFGVVLVDSWERVAWRVRGVREWFDELSEVVQKVSPRWKLDRMAPVDRSILRLGAWEILHGDVPPIAVISASVDLGKDYGEKGTPAFVNGLLDQICKDHNIPMR